MKIETIELIFLILFVFLSGGALAIFLCFGYLNRPRLISKSKKQKQYEADIKEMSEFPLI
jgi:hypothetical protein